MTVPTEEAKAGGFQIQIQGQLAKGETLSQMVKKGLMAWIRGRAHS